MRQKRIDVSRRKFLKATGLASLAPAGESTMTAILGRTAIYQGREVKWEEVVSA